MKLGLRYRSTSNKAVTKHSGSCIVLRNLHVLLCLMLLLGGFAASAQNLGLAVRVVQGVVRNETDQPQANAVVYLQDQKSLQVRTYITEADGRYRFGQLNSDVDYQLWAEFKGHKSKTRSISSFDSKKQFLFDLKIDTSK
jgi:hypothetical protein